jgi:hypothetical protein
MFVFFGIRRGEHIFNQRCSWWINFSIYLYQISVWPEISHKARVCWQEYRFRQQNIFSSHSDCSRVILKSSREKNSDLPGNSYRIQISWTVIDISQETSTYKLPHWRETS